MAIEHFLSYLAGVACFKEGHLTVQSRLNGYDARPFDFQMIYIYCASVQLYLSPDAQHYGVSAVSTTQMAALWWPFWVPFVRIYKQQEEILTVGMSGSKSLSENVPPKSRIVELRRLVVIKANGTYRYLQEVFATFKFHLFKEEGTIKGHYTLQRHFIL